MRRPFALGLVVVAGALLLLPGCGPRKVKITGRLVNKSGVAQTFPVEQYVTLQFVPADLEGGQRRSYPAHIDNTTGTYDVEIIAGKYRVSLFVAPTGVASGKTAPLVGRPTGVSNDATEHEFKSNTTYDITVP